MSTASDEPVQGPSNEITLTIEHVSEEAAPLLLFLLQELDGVSLMVQEILAVVPADVGARRSLRARVEGTS